MMASVNKVALKSISSLDALSYVLYNLDTIKYGCSKSFSDLFFTICSEGILVTWSKTYMVDKEIVVNKLTVKVGWYYN